MKWKTGPFLCIGSVLLRNYFTIGARNVRTYLVRKISLTSKVLTQLSSATLKIMSAQWLLTRFVLLPLWAVDSRGELSVTRESVPCAVSVSPVVRVTAVPNTFPAAGSRQGQRGTLRGKTQKRKSKQLTRSSERLLSVQKQRWWTYQRRWKRQTQRPGMSDLIGGTHAGLVWNVIGSAQLLDGLSWHGLWEAQTTPGVGGGPHFSNHGLL